MVRMKIALLALSLGCTVLAHPLPAHAVEDNAPCDIRGCGGGGWGGVPGPGPSDPDTNGIAIPPGGDNRNFKAADTRANKADKKNAQHGVAKTITPMYQNTKAVGSSNLLLQYRR